MAENISADMDRFKALGHSAFVMGYSGVAGAALVKELSKLKIFKKVVLIGRRALSQDYGPEFEQKVVDYEKLDDHKDVFKDLDVGFCCMGAHSKDVSKEDYVRINKDYVVNSAQIAKEQGCKHFTIITSKGSNKSSFLHALRIKAELEAGLEAINFERLSIFRPAKILQDGKASMILKPVIYAFPTALSVPDETFAKAMINNAVRPIKSSPVEIYENKDIHKLAKDS
uniref:NAD(P)-binding domain-containing protein n=3 Tax=Arion vulgaris TaxID=1028688 RepID=A0A0B6ZEF6_9EUPU